MKKFKKWTISTTLAHQPLNRLNFPDEIIKFKKHIIKKRDKSKIFSCLNVFLWKLNKHCYCLILNHAGLEYSV